MFMNTEQLPSWTSTPNLLSSSMAVPRMSGVSGAVWVVALWRVSHYHSNGIPRLLPLKWVEYIDAHFWCQNPVKVCCFYSNAHNLPDPREISAPAPLTSPFLSTFTYFPQSLGQEFRDQQISVFFLSIHLVVPFCWLAFRCKGLGWDPLA